jgi:hypothetical protein
MLQVIPKSYKNTPWILQTIRAEIMEVITSLKTIRGLLIQGDGQSNAGDISGTVEAASAELATVLGDLEMAIDKAKSESKEPRSLIPFWRHKKQLTWDQDRLLGLLGLFRKVQSTIRTAQQSLERYAQWGSVGKL